MGRRPPEGTITEEPASDEVTRGGVRIESHLAADLKLAERSAGAAPIGGLVEREIVEIGGRVRSMAIGNESGVHELRCVLSDNSGSITLVFQGRSEVPGIERGTRLMVKGTVTSLRREAVILNPQYEIIASPQGEN
jgi:RecG-like helicase